MFSECPEYDALKQCVSSMREYWMRRVPKSYRRYDSVLNVLTHTEIIILTAALSLEEGLIDSFPYKDIHHGAMLIICEVLDIIEKDIRIKG